MAGTYLFALAAVYLQVPIYSTAKATYASGLTPLIGVAAGAGFDALPRKPWVRALATGLIGCWLACVVLSAIASAAP